MSIPIRASDGCVVGSKFNHHDNVPFWFKLTGQREETFSHCPTGIHKSTKITSDIVLPFVGTKIGEFVRHMRGSEYIIILEHKFRKFFFQKSVYCKECSEWH